MSKIKQYSKTFGIFYDNYRRWYKQMVLENRLENHPEEQFQDFFLKNFAQTMDDATAIQLFIRDLKHELIHIYMSNPDLQLFLKTAEIKDLSGIKNYIKDNGTKVLVNEDDNLCHISGGANLAFCLHIPNERQGYVICYSLYETNDELRIFINHGIEQYHLSSIDYENKNSIVYSDQEINEVAHFAINLIAYICCFPECFIDGAPHGIKTENNYRLHLSDKIIVDENNTNGPVNPHFRRGYFKRLDSDFYKNKKGQIIFVHETVINAKAKHIR